MASTSSGFACFSRRFGCFWPLRLLVKAMDPANNSAFTCGRGNAECSAMLAQTVHDSILLSLLDSAVTTSDLLHGPHDLSFCIFVISCIVVDASLRVGGSWVRM